MKAYGPAPDQRSQNLVIAMLTAAGFTDEAQAILGTQTNPSVTTVGIHVPTEPTPGLEFVTGDRPTSNP